ncbi:MAG: FAD binding domain-containing protein, partial [Saprospiraceae bacterium]|nr:FAD binding domain-containing protein [Saprospiraceae bacterium]
LIAEGVVPAWMGGIADRLGAMEAPEPELFNLPDTTLVGGGTDLYVQQPHAMPNCPVLPASRIPALHGIRIEDGTCSIGAAETMSSLQHSALLNDLLPGLHDFMAPVGSTQIRNTATLAGNLVNASPIGDLTILFLALDSSLSLSNGREVRTVRLRDFYLGYKQLALQEGECVQSLMFQLPSPEAGLHFERVCKRTYLDVASVNSACLLEMGDDGTIQQIHLSMGGVAPIPKYLAETCSFFLGKTPDRTLVWKGIEVLQDEIAPISDIRGSADYKRLLARQQLLIHFSRLAPAFVDLKSLLGA